MLDKPKKIKPNANYANHSQPVDSFLSVPKFRQPKSKRREKEIRYDYHDAKSIPQLSVSPAEARFLFHGIEEGDVERRK